MCVRPEQPAGSLRTVPATRPASGSLRKKACGGTEWKLFPTHEVGQHSVGGPTPRSPAQRGRALGPVSFVAEETERGGSARAP